VTTFTVLGLALTIAGTTISAQEKLDRTVLPIAEPKRPTYRELDARKAKPPARFEVKAPKGAPNVVIVLIDDIGFGGPSTFGGPIRTPTLDQLAQGGLRFNNFHTTALCSPTRVALKSGLPLHRRHDEPGHQLGESPAVDDAGQAVFRLLRARGGIVERESKLSGPAAIIYCHGTEVRSNFESSFRASWRKLARPGIQNFRRLLDTSFRRYDGKTPDDLFYAFQLQDTSQNSSPLFKSLQKSPTGTIRIPSSVRRLLGSRQTMRHCLTRG